MKKFELFALIALAMAAGACNKEKEFESAPEEAVIPAEPGKIVFTAQAPTRTATTDDQTVTWVADDEVKFVWDSGSTTARASSSGASTTFTIDAPDGVNEIYAVYPAAAGGSYGEGKVGIHFNGSRTDGSFAANDFCVAKAVKTGDTWSTTLAFKNVACLLKVGVAGSDVTKIQVMGGKAASSAQNISGYLPVSIDNNGDPIFGTASETGNTVSVTVSGPGDYYIPVMPGVTLSEGFRIGVFKGEEQTTPFFYNASFTTTRGQIVMIADLDSHAGHFYVTPNGDGSKAGQSWSNAMDAAGFKAFVEDEDNFFLLTGSTFHFSADEFSFGNDYVKPAYPNHANVAFTLEGTVTATDTTTFLGRTATSGTTAGVLWPQNNSYITIKNVKFTGTNGASNASAIRLNNSAKELTLDHCYFRDNQTSGNGGAISLFNSATLTIKDCSFSNNTGAGGIIHINHESAKVNIQDCEAKCITKNAIYAQTCNTLTCTRVTFKDNNDAGEYGAAAYISGTGTISFNDCDFIRNHTSIQGGAVCIKGSGVTTTFTECRFSNNSSDQKAGAFMIENGNATTTFTECEFSDNQCVQQGGAIVIGSGNATTITDCNFIDNHSDKRGGAVMFESGSDNNTITGGKFQGNHADGVDDTLSAGSAIYAIGDGVTFNCSGVLFKSNYSNVGTNERSGGIIRVENATGKATFDNCVFDGNYCCRPSGSANPACAAIINNRTVSGPTYYFNACEFKNNASGTYAGVGAKYGMVFAMYSKTTLAFNNCSIHDNFGGRNTDPIDWIYVDNSDVTLILSNSSVIGDPSRKTSASGSASKRNGNGVFRLQQDANYYFINNILCSPTDGNAFDCSNNNSITIENSYYNKTSPVTLGSSNSCNWGTDTGSGHDYYATSACFGNWSAPWTWNGTLTGTNSNMLAATADVNTEIQSADADFYSWLNSIEALGKDINGNSRGATSWPGCYQN